MLPQRDSCGSLNNRERGLLCLLSVLDEITSRVVAKELVKTKEQRCAVLQQVFYMFIDEYYYGANSSVLHVFQENLGVMSTFLKLYARFYSSLFGTTPQGLLDEYKNYLAGEKLIQRSGIVLICPDMEHVICTLQDFRQPAGSILCQQNERQKIGRAESGPIEREFSLPCAVTGERSFSSPTATAQLMSGAPSPHLPSSTPKKQQSGRLVFPQGKLEKGESLIDCAIREIYEETGIKVYKDQLVKYSTVKAAAKPRGCVPDPEDKKFLIFQRIAHTTPINLYFCILDEEPTISPIFIGEVSHAFKVPIAYMLTDECASSSAYNTPAQSAPRTPRTTQRSPLRGTSCDRRPLQQQNQNNTRGKSPTTPQALKTYFTNSSDIAYGEQGNTSISYDDQASELSTASQEDPLTVGGSLKFRCICRDIAKCVNAIRVSYGMDEMEQDKTAELTCIYET